MFARAGLSAAVYAILVIESLRFGLMQCLLRSAFNNRLRQTLSPMAPGVTVGAAVAVVAYTLDTLIPFVQPLHQVVAVVICTILALLPLSLHSQFKMTIGDLRSRLAPRPNALAVAWKAETLLRE